jgi:hypothetical protein
MFLRIVIERTGHYRGEFGDIRLQRFLKRKDKSLLAHFALLPFPLKDGVCDSATISSFRHGGLALDFRLS